MLEEDRLISREMPVAPKRLELQEMDSIIPKTIWVAHRHLALLEMHRLISKEILVTSNPQETPVIKLRGLQIMVLYQADSRILRLLHQLIQITATIILRSHLRGIISRILRRISQCSAGRITLLSLKTNYLYCIKRNYFADSSSSSFCL